MTADDSVDWAAAYRYLEVQLESVLARVADRMEQLEADVEQARRGRVRSVSLSERESGDLESIIAADGSDLTYRFAIYRDDALVREHTSGSSNTMTWRPSGSGIYRVEGFARTSGDQRTDTGTSQSTSITMRTE